MLKQFRKTTPLILQLGLLIAAIIILVLGVILWQFFSMQNEPVNGTSGTEVGESSTKPSPEPQPTETAQATSIATQTQVVLPPTESATATHTATNTVSATPTLSQITPTFTATNTSTPTLESKPTPEAIACVIARNTMDNGFNIRTEPDDEASFVDSYGAVPGTKLEVLMGTISEGTWWYVRLDRGVEGWANLGPLITGDLIEVLPSCEE